MSYLADVKSQLEELHIDLFERAWKEVVEPALKVSYKNGVEAGRAGKDDESGPASRKGRRQWSRKRTRSEANNG